MPLTKLDNVAALVVIDLQKGIVGLQPSMLRAILLAAPQNWRVLSAREVYPWLSG
jgi:hypothetical protein